MTRIVYLRPHTSLSAYEMSYVALLRDEFELDVVTTGEPAIGGAPNWVTRMSWPDEVSWGGRRRSILNGLYARILGRRYHIPGISRMLRGADIVQAGEAASECSYQAALFKESLDYRLMLTVSENQPILESRSPAETRRIRYTLGKVDHVLAIPAAARGRIVEAGFPADKVTVIGHGTDCDRFAPRPGPRREGRIRLGFCGRFQKEKGLDVLLDSVRDLDIEIRLLGSGPERRALAEKAGPGVTFLEPLPYDEIHAFYADIDIFVLPSVPTPGLVEQFGFVLLEAMASGVPVIASAIGGIPEVLGDAGILVRPADVPALRNAILRLVGDDNLRLETGAAGRRRVLERFNRVDVALKMKTVYRRILEEKRCQEAATD